MSEQEQFSLAAIQARQAAMATYMIRLPTPTECWRTCSPALTP